MAAEPCRAGSYPDRAHILSLLTQREFLSLEKLLMTAQGNSEKDVANEIEAKHAFDAFATVRPEIEALLTEWIERYPKSYAAWLANGKYFAHLGWHERGSKWAKDTPKESFERMNAAFARAVHSATTALSLRPGAVECYAVLTQIAMAKGENERERALVQEALERTPESFRIRRVHMQALLPRWGGSYLEMTIFARKSQRYATTNPKLRRLMGVVVWDKGNIAVRNKEYPQAVQYFTEALEAGEYATFYADRAEAYRRMKQYDSALADVDRAVELSPQAPGILANRSRILSGLGRFEDAKRDLELAARLDPGEGTLSSAREWLASALVSRAWQLHRQGEHERASAHFDEAVRADTTRAETFYWRGAMYQRKGNLDQAQADLEEAIRLDPRHFQSYRSLDWVLTRRKRWDQAIAHWNRFLELEPNNADAYLERAGTFHHQGNQTAAMRDLKKACDLGNAKACQIQAREDDKR